MGCGFLGSYGLTADALCTVFDVLASKTFNKKSDAESWAWQNKSLIDSGKLQQPDRQQQTLNDLLQRYRAEMTIRKKGQAAEVSRISTLLNHSIAAQRVTQFNASHVASYRDGRLEWVCRTPSTRN